MDLSAHPVVLHLIDSAVDKAPLGGGRVVRVEQHMAPGPAVARQQPIHLHNGTLADIIHSHAWHHDGHHDGIPKPVDARRSNKQTNTIFRVRYIRCSDETYKTWQDFGGRGRWQKFGSFSLVWHALNMSGMEARAARAPSYRRGTGRGCWGRRGSWCRGPAGPQYTAAPASAAAAGTL